MRRFQNDNKLSKLVTHLSIISTSKTLIKILIHAEQLNFLFGTRMVGKTKQTMQ